MHVSHSMALEDFATQLREIVEAQPFSPQRELTIDLIDQITEGPTEDDIQERIVEESDKSEKAGTRFGRESMHGEMLQHFEDFGQAADIGLTETQHEQILDLLGQVKP